MTLPDERTRALQYSRDFLRALLDPKLTPKVPKDIRRWAARCLRHFPSDLDIAVAARKAPNTWGPVKWRDDGDSGCGC
jgi:hypothetical protein